MARLGAILELFEDIIGILAYLGVGGIPGCVETLFGRLLDLSQNAMKSWVGGERWIGLN